MKIETQDKKRHDNARQLCQSGCYLERNMPCPNKQSVRAVDTFTDLQMKVSIAVAASASSAVVLRAGCSCMGNTSMTEERSRLNSHWQVRHRRRRRPPYSSTRLDHQTGVFLPPSLALDKKPSSATAVLALSQARQFHQQLTNARPLLLIFVLTCTSLPSRCCEGGCL